jgi:hypothetical protein
VDILRSRGFITLFVSIPGHVRSRYLRIATMLYNTVSSNADDLVQTGMVKNRAFRYVPFEVQLKKCRGLEELQVRPRG